MDLPNSEPLALRILERAQALITETHLVYQSGLHGSAYVNKDDIYVDVDNTYDLCRMMVCQFLDAEIDVVAGPALGGINLKTLAALAFREYGQLVRGVHAEWNDEVVLKMGNAMEISLYTSLDSSRMEYLRVLESGQQLVIRDPSMTLKRGYGKVVKGQRVLVVEDILTTGQSAKRTAEAVAKAGGTVVGVAAICNRSGGKVTAETMGVPVLHSLVNLDLATYPADTCPLCRDGVPINTEIGHGKAFLAAQRQ